MPSTGAHSDPEWTVPADGDVWSHTTVETNGVELHAVIAGPADGELVVLLHGFPEFWYAWRHQIPALAAAGYRVVAPDMRGYNHSEKPGGVAAYDIDELVSDVVGLVRAFGRESAHVVGHDWGGVVAWQTAIDRPSVVDRLGVLNAPHPTAYERLLRRSPAQLRKSWYALYVQLPWLPECSLAWDDYALLDHALGEGTVHPDAFTRTDIRRYKTALAQPGARTAALNYYRALFRRNARRTLTRGGVGDQPVRVPTLLVWGEQDDALDVRLSEGLEEWVSDLRVERLPDASHWVQFDAPDRVTEELLAHLGSDAGGTRSDGVPDSV
ncbi:alpha/beta fold hydrolase [Haloarcula pellucida]|uniref:Epoxide hydrolase n=1 Tax=Haloarcula pellucida TaxID=1427151 RepID=A0A830GLX0_9EURY|nr:alpha/beta hydrolase [Halomicroarcula pellucida]MBX0348587.1 alpha/beta hydrolase [Halomicroarcula pellucida]GGN92706.1 epoxide hydrolase [Halomicroarcula pellucida]